MKDKYTFVHVIKQECYEEYFLSHTNTELSQVLQVIHHQYQYSTVLETCNCSFTLIFFS